jgi:hypothetical protein
LCRDLHKYISLLGASNEEVLPRFVVRISGPELAPDCASLAASVRLFYLFDPTAEFQGDAVGCVGGNEHEFV